MRHANRTRDAGTVPTPDEIETAHGSILISLERLAEKAPILETDRIATSEAVGVLQRAGLLLESDATTPGEHGPDTESIILVRGDDLKVEPIRWLWSDWLARGKLRILAGAPGTGKSTISLTLAAVVTVGGRWPGGVFV